jgi:mutator protein MutT
MGLLFESNGLILIAKRDSSKKYGGLWEFPGGKIEGSETAEEALEREILEEMSAPVKVRRVYDGYVFSHEGLQAEFIPVAGTIEPKDITLNEHEAHRFIMISELRNFDFSPPDYGAIDLIENNTELF